MEVRGELVIEDVLVLVLVLVVGRCITAKPFRHFRH